LQTFKERSKEMDYSNLNYPYADKGPTKMRRLENTIFAMIAFTASSALFGYIGNSIKVENPVKPQEIANQAQQIGQSANDSSQLISKLFNTDFGLSNLQNGGSTYLLKNTLKNISLGASSLCKFIAIMLLIVSFILLLNYLLNVKRRAHEFERNIIKNDIIAVALYRKIQNSLRIHKRLSEAKRTARPKSSGNGPSEAPSADNIAKVDELKAMRKMDIRVNTRQKLASDKINTMYSIYMDLPLDETVASNLLKRVENLNETVTRLAKGVVTIGGYQVTEDRQTIVFQGETPDIDDPYNYDERLANKADDNVEVVYYESAYPITDLVDRQDTIDAKKELASEWAQRTGAMLDRFLITAKMKVTRINTNVSSSKATYLYDMALDSNLSGGFNKFDDTLDKTFKLKGSTVNVVNGCLEIVLPIPKDYNIPINVPTLYRQAFGEVKH
jgi:hypothetical protein